MVNPLEFWKNSEIGRKAANSFERPPDYEKNMLTFEDSDELVFEKVAKILCAENPNEFLEKGYLDLDKSYHQSEDEIVIAVREQTEIKTPYFKRRAYLVKIPLKEDDFGVLEFATCEDTKNEKLKRLWGLVCQFHNEELGDYRRYRTEKFIDENGTLSERKVEEPENGFNYLNCSLFMSPEMVERLEKNIPHEEENPVKEMFVFVITRPVRMQKYNEKPSISIFADDFVPM